MDTPTNTTDCDSTNLPYVGDAFLYVNIDGGISAIDVQGDGTRVVRYATEYETNRYRMFYGHAG